MRLHHLFISYGITTPFIILSNKDITAIYIGQLYRLRIPAMFVYVFSSVFTNQQKIYTVSKKSDQCGIKTLSRRHEIMKSDTI